MSDQPELEEKLKAFIDELENDPLWHSGANKSVVISRLKELMEEK